MSNTTSPTRAFSALALMSALLLPAAANFLPSAKEAPVLPEVALMPSPIVTSTVVAP